MALFKINRGNSVTLPSAMTDGWAYFCTDTGEFFIDYADSNGELHRKQINADEAKKLTGYDIKTIINDSEVEIPTSKAVLDALNLKQDVITGTEGQYVGFDVDGNTAAFDLPSEVIISDTEPTDETAEIWINTSEEWNDNLPEQVQADLNQTDETAPDYVKGTVDHTRLPEGYPYKEVTVVNEPLNLTFGDNWEEELENPILVSNMFIKVSDIVLTNEEVRDVTFIYHSNGTGDRVFTWEDVEGMAMMSDDFSIIGESGAVVVFIRTPGVDLTEYEFGVFPEVGIYVINGLHYGRITSITTTKPIERRTETIHSIAEEFLPAGVGVQVLKVDGNVFDGSATVPLLYEGIRKMVKKGLVYLELDGGVLAAYAGDRISGDFTVEGMVFSVFSYVSSTLREAHIIIYTDESIEVI